MLNSNNEVWFSNHTKSVTIGQFEEEKFVEKENLCDDHLSTYSRIFGFASYGEICALRHQDGISVIQKQKKQLLSRVITEVGFCDMTFLSYLDSLLSIDVKGNLILHNYLVIIFCYYIRF